MLRNLSVKLGDRMKQEFHLVYTVCVCVCVYDS